MREPCRRIDLRKERSEGERGRILTLSGNEVDVAIGEITHEYSEGCPEKRKSTVGMDTVNSRRWIEGEGLRDDHSTKLARSLVGHHLSISIDHLSITPSTVSYRHVARNG